MSVAETSIKGNICIVGGSRTHNELLATFLGSETALDCYCDTSPVNFRGRHAWGPAVFLLDCLNLCCEAVLDVVAVTAMEMQSAEILALLNLDHELMIEQGALKMGVKGFFYEGDSPQTIREGVMAILRGDYWVSRKVLVECICNPLPESSPKDDCRFGLSHRESQVFLLLAEGLSNKCIADRLCISLATVKTHVSKVLKKINASSRRDVMRLVSSHYHH